MPSNLTVLEDFIAFSIKDIFFSIILFLAKNIR